ncbi:MAG: diacylglycerol kinase (ATP) [Flavobacteriales bacterium]
MFFAGLLLPLAHWLPVNTVERILLVVSVILVLIVELLNSSVEAVADRVGYEHHELAGRQKILLLQRFLLAWGSGSMFGVLFVSH